MNKLLQLGEVLDKIDECSEDADLFLPMDEDWNESTRCAVLEYDAYEIEEPAFAREQGLRHALGIVVIKDIVDNARQQVSQHSLQMLLEAFLFYYDNDAFIEFESPGAN